MEMKMQEVQEEKMPLEDMKEKLSDLRNRIMTLEWDKSHNQLNSSMEAKYAQIKTEFESLQKKVDGIKEKLKEEEAASEAAEAAATPTEAETVAVQETVQETQK